MVFALVTQLQFYIKVFWLFLFLLNAMQWFKGFYFLYIVYLSFFWIKKKKRHLRIYFKGFCIKFKFCALVQKPLIWWDSWSPGNKRKMNIEKDFGILTIPWEAFPFKNTRTGQMYIFSSQCNVMLDPIKSVTRSTTVIPFLSLYTNRTIKMDRDRDSRNWLGYDMVWNVCNHGLSCY